MIRRVIGRSRSGHELVAHEQGERGGLLVFGVRSMATSRSPRRSASASSRARASRHRAASCPSSTPTALARNHKDNAAGVDLNRNFAAKSFSTAHPVGYFPGPHALSEPESAALAALVEARSPRVIVAVHQPFACVNWDGPADELAELMGEACGLPLAPSLGYPTPGSFGSWRASTSGSRW